ncbi:FliH/SctL family protein [Ferrimicrobium sp.]|uniref:FliH/SctL family protein n=1 Tax=Ferrimicrobium sp. TaxID=2926050 RepID=UPI0026161989|nr:FliH/SctL family protein [Ferrimicrobium sp.]
MDPRSNPSDVIRLDLPSVDSVLEDIGLGSATASRSMSEWREELELARNEGFTAGIDHAKGVLDREVKEELERNRRNNELLDAAIRGLHQARAHQFSLELAEIVRFALELTQRILRTEIVDPVDRIQKIVDETAEAAATHETFVVRVAAQNIEAVNSAVLPRLLDQGFEAVVVVGEGFGPHDLVIESGARVLDARIATAFERVVNEVGSWHHDS